MEERAPSSFPNLKPKHFMDSKHNKCATFVKPYIQTPLNWGEDPKTNEKQKAHKQCLV
jgi:hypothetical protein